MSTRSADAATAAIYEIADDQMAMGSTLGAPKATLTLKATGAIERFYSIEAGATLIGTVVLHHWDETTGIRLPPRTGRFVLHPERQEHFFSLSNGVTVHEEAYVLSGTPHDGNVDPPAAYLVVELRNDSDQHARVATYASAKLRGETSHDVVTAYSPKHHAILAWNASRPDVARSYAWTGACSSFEVTLDSGKASALRFPGPLSNRTLRRTSEPLAILCFRHALRPGQRSRFALVLSFSLDGKAALLRSLKALPSAPRALHLTQRHYDQVLNRAVVLSPDPDVNRGVAWSKANMLRVELLAQTGWCFVNDPTRSNNSVARDTAWFAFGADYITPDFSRESLLWYARHLERNGMVAEYYDIRTGKRADYGLNINDNTPLLVLAAWHHYNTTGDAEFLRTVYPKAVKAAHRILDQRDARGLVWCRAAGSADWGICGWRNVIPNYRLSGATTELNSECFAALQTVAHMAHALKKHRAAEEFEQHAAALRAAINEHLLNRSTGLYYLNIDLEGNPHTDITSDQVFPLMFGVADDRTAAHIIARLSVPEFWSEAGIHTVPRNDISYSPVDGYGLLGGVWVGVTFWYAFAAARFNPEFMAYALSSSFRHYSRNPKRNNTVPGQFSEWLHGETLANCGMMLSPWFPPRYLWAAIEGAAGLDLSGAQPSLNPRLAPDWKWLGVRNLPLRGRNTTWFVVRTPGLHMYANFQFDRAIETSFYHEDASAKIAVVGDGAVTIALRRNEAYVVLIGNTSDRTTTSAWSLQVDPRAQYAVKWYNSQRGAWIESKASGRDVRRGLAVQLEQKGFCVIELREAL